MQSSDTDVINNITFDWLVTTAKEKKISILKTQTKGTTQNELDKDIVNLVKEGVDFSNANLKHFGIGPVFPLILATGKYFSFLCFNDKLFMQVSNSSFMV